MDLASRFNPSELSGNDAPSADGASIAPRQHNVQCLGPGGLHRMVYTEWGAPENEDVVICVHGLTRNGRDFDYLARALSDRFRVVCPDVVGRGLSDWLQDKQGYVFPTYLADMVTLLARLNVRSVSWVGTSMGGVIGMMLAGLRDTPIQRLVLNDMGPVITPESLKRIGEHVGRAPVFPTVTEAEAWLREVCAPFGRLSDVQWQHLTRHSIVPVKGGYRMRYDPAIGDVFRTMPLDKPIDLWEGYRAVRCPTLAIRGELSDLLPRDALARMALEGPRAKTVEIKGVGHAPTLMEPEQISIVRDFLLESV